MDYAEANQRGLLAVAFADGAGELQRPLVVVGGLLVPALGAMDVAEAGQCVQLGRLVAGDGGELQRVLVVVGGLLVPALHTVDHAKAGQSAQLGRLVARGVDVDVGVVGPSLNVAARRLRRQNPSLRQLKLSLRLRTPRLGQ